MTARDEAMAASYHADTADAERKAMYDMAAKLAAALMDRGCARWSADDFPCVQDLPPESWCTACAALEAWKPYKPIWEVTG